MLLDLIPAPYRLAVTVAGAALLAAAAFSAGWAANGWRLGAQVSAAKAEAKETAAMHERTAREAVEAARAREDRVTTIAEGIVHEARQILADAQRDAAAADSARDRMLNAAKRAAGRCSAGATAAAGGGGAPGGMPAGMSDGDRLLFVLTRADARAGELAADLDRARTAGLACERTYDAAREAAREAVK